MIYAQPIALLPATSNNILMRLSIPVRNKRLKREESVARGLYEFFELKYQTDRLVVCKDEVV